MVEYGWIFAGMFVLAFLQLAIFIFLHRRQSAFRKSTRDEIPSDPAGNRLEEREGSGRRCPSCGAVNNADFEFCRSCVSQL